MMRFSLVSVCVAAVLLVAAPMQAQAQLQWGVMGHYMTAAIAQPYLSRTAQNAVTNLLPETNGDMAMVASWADAVGRNLYKWSAPLHYINTPDWDCTYQRTRDCNDAQYPGAYCVDGAIQNFTSQLVSNSAPLTLNVALKFVIHFIGDIHQPLHVGFAGDEGGNTEYGTFEGTPNRKLHQVWDNDMIDKRIKDDFQNNNNTYLQYFLTRLKTGDWSTQLPSWQSCPTSEPTAIKACSQSWASQSVVLACSTAYVDQNGDKIQNGFNLADPYYQFALPVVEMQLARGGIRLANVLNSIFSAENEELAEYMVEPREFQRREAQRRAEGKLSSRARLHKLKLGETIELH